MHASVSFLHGKAACSSRFVSFFSLYLLDSFYARVDLSGCEPMTSTILYWILVSSNSMLPTPSSSVKTYKFMKQTILPQSIFITLNDSREQIKKVDFFQIFETTNGGVQQLSYGQRGYFQLKFKYSEKMQPTYQKGIFTFHFTVFLAHFSNSSPSFTENKTLS